MATQASNVESISQYTIVFHEESPRAGGTYTSQYSLKYHVSPGHLLTSLVRAYEFKAPGEGIHFG